MSELYNYSAPHKFIQDLPSVEGIIDLYSVNSKTDTLVTTRQSKDFESLFTSTTRTKTKRSNSIKEFNINFHINRITKKISELLKGQDVFQSHYLKNGKIIRDYDIKENAMISPEWSVESSIEKFEGNWERENFEPILNNQELFGYVEKDISYYMENIV